MDKIMGLVLKAYHEGRSASLETQVRFYRYGTENVVPSEWNDYAKQAADEADPEYQTYLRLREKFENE
jgi:hypothetical protein